MRALILSDIHSNLEALEAVLAAAPEHEAVWNLGDVVGYGASPNEVVERVRGLGALSVRGNHDRACSGLIPLDGFNSIASYAAQWTQAVLTEENKAWLRALPRGPIEADGPQVLCAHGSIFDEDEYVMTLRDAWPPLRHPAARITFFGHTHLQGGFATSGDEQFQLAPVYHGGDEAEGYELPLRDGARYLLNPGSVGQPRDQDWRAAFALYDSTRKTVDFYRVPYDVHLAQQKILRVGLPDRLAARLHIGR